MYFMTETHFTVKTSRLLGVIVFVVLCFISFLFNYFLFSNYCFIVFNYCFVNNNNNNDKDSILEVERPLIFVPIFVLLVENNTLCYPAGYQGYQLHVSYLYSE